MTESYRIGSEAIAGPYLEDEVVCPRNPIVQALKPVLDWMSIYGVFWRERFDRLESLLKRMDQ